jgi:predicted TPR repeat methyltransferase
MNATMNAAPPLTDPSPAVSVLLARGHDRRYADDLAGAEPWFRAAAAAAPANAEAWGALGEVLAGTGRLPDAVAALARAEALDPGQPFRLAALAEAEAANGDAAAAAATCRRWLILCPGSAPAQRTLATQLLRLGEPSAAAAALREVVLLDPEQAGAMTTLAGLLTEAGDPLAALELAQPTLRRVPDHAGLQFQIGRAWQRLGETTKAVAAWRRCLALADDAAPEGRAALAALTALTAADSDDTAPGQAPDATYVRALFDRYAERFDSDLMGRLNYRAPHLLHEAVRHRPGFDAGGLEILDLGCGTGLAGLVFAPHAATLAGVDLSPRMVDQARRRGIYHRLEAGDLMTVLNRESDRWHLIVAADVFTYLGDLGPVLTAAARALRPGGLLAGTVELAPEDDGVIATPSRRIRHGTGHLRRAADAAGLVTVSRSRATLRTEKQEPVTGLVFVLQRPQGTVILPDAAPPP